MEYKDKLAVDSHIPFGIEIEVSNQRTSSLTKNILEQSGFTDFQYDFLHIAHQSSMKYASLIKDYQFFGTQDDKDHYWLYHYENCSDHNIFDGLEITSPILYNTSESFNQIAQVINMLQKIKARAGERTGAHIHIGASPFTNKKQLEILLKLYAVYEPIFYLYSKNGNLGHVRKQAEYSAEPVRNSIKNILLEDNILENYIANNTGVENKHSAIHFKHFDLNDPEYGSSFEFRCFNGTVDYKIWQNYINLILNFVSYVLNNEVDEDYLNYRLQQIIKIRDEWTIDETLSDAKKALIKEFENVIYSDDLDRQDFDDHIKGKCLCLK